MITSQKLPHSRSIVSPSRRNLIKGVGAGLLAAGMATTGLQSASLLAQATPSDEHQAAFYRFAVGQFEIMIINDGSFHFPTAAFGTNAPEGAVADLLDAHYLPRDVATLQLHCMLIDTGAHLVLIDTGMGFFTFPGDTRNSGKLLSTLALLGIRREEIDTVILSHGHPDHVGGATLTPALSGSRAGRMTFPNARYVMPQSEWDFWTGLSGSEEDPFFDFMIKVANQSLQPLEPNLELMSADFIAEQGEIVPGIQAVAAPGHTMGHTIFRIASEGEEIIHMVDVGVHPVVAIERPDWFLAVEMDPEAALATRNRLFGQASSERTLIFGNHFAFPGVGYLLTGESEAGWRWLPTG